MSHADDGTLHAYLDGELSPVERERLERHLADCAACRARRDEERALIERADALLARAAPPDRAAPPLSELRRPRPAWVLRFPLAWAAMLVLAFGVGWYLRGGPSPDTLGPAAPLTLVPGADSARRDVAAPASQTRNARRADRAEARVTTGALQDSFSGAAAEAPAPRVLAPQNQAALRGAAPAPVPPTRVTLRQAARAPLFDARNAPTSTTWPVIAAGPAREVLGGEPAQIPGLPVLGIRRNPADAAEIVVEQGVDSATVVEIYQRRLTGVLREKAPAVPALNPQEHAPRANAALVERPSRTIGSLRVEIAGPLPADSLRKLLGLIR
ncbi:MAG TPA: zf-HC2 domain-containing protein [Gemmatimonadales bacterium]